jgi:hypothetical protein
LLKRRDGNELDGGDIVKRPRLVIAVDFDGTIVKNRWPNIGESRLGAKTVLKWLKRRGHKLILSTCREGKMLSLAWLHLLVWLDGITFDACNENLPELIHKYGGDCRKISADWYIDDLAGFLGWWSIPIIVLWLEWTKRLKLREA